MLYVLLHVEKSLFTVFPTRIKWALWIGNIIWGECCPNKKSQFSTVASSTVATMLILYPHHSFKQSEMFWYTFLQSTLLILIDLSWFITYLISYGYFDILLMCF